MPFSSYAQMAYLKHNHPNIYARWVREHGEKVRPKPGHSKVRATKKAK